MFFLNRTNRGRLRLTGRDRLSFLQGMVTNDVGGLTPGYGNYNFLLDATGHVLADARVLCTADFLLMDVEPQTADFVAKTLDKYLIMEKCVITDASDYTAQILIGGIDAPAFLDNLGLTDTANWAEGTNGAAEIAGVPVLVAATKMTVLPAFDLYFPKDSYLALADFLKAQSVEEISDDRLETLRIAAGLPRFGLDIDSRVLAPETGQSARAISFHKGCYIGQEIVARIDARGHTNKTFAGFTLDGDNLPRKDTPIVVESKEVGRLTSAAQHNNQIIALGYIRNEFAASGTVVSIGDISATVTEPPFSAGK